MVSLSAPKRVSTGSLNSRRSTVTRIPQAKGYTPEALRLCVWLCDNCGIELFYADYYFPFALRTV